MPAQHEMSCRREAVAAVVAVAREYDERAVPARHSLGRVRGRARGVLHQHDGRNLIALRGCSVRRAHVGRHIEIFHFLLPLQNHHRNGHAGLVRYAQKNFLYSFVFEAFFERF